MLILKKIPSVNHNQVDVYYKSLSFLDMLKHVFSSQVTLPVTYAGVGLYQDILLLDPTDNLVSGQKYDQIVAVYNEQEPDLHKMINHTVYHLTGVIPYGILDDAKVCSVDRFDIQLDRCWKSNY